MSSYYQMHVTLVKTPTLYSYWNTNHLRHLQHTEALTILDTSNILKHYINLMCMRN